MQNVDVVKTEAAWSSLAGKVYEPHSEEEYRPLVVLIDSLIDEIGEDESHPLASLMEIVGVLIEKYEDENVPELSDVLDDVKNASRSFCRRRRICVEDDLHRFQARDENNRHGCDQGDYKVSVTVSECVGLGFDLSADDNSGSRLCLFTAGRVWK